jgi:hypothetical protein
VKLIVIDLQQQKITVGTQKVTKIIVQSVLMYSAYVQPSKRKILCEDEITLDRALDFLKEFKDGVIYEGDVEKTKEELKHAKSLRSLPGIGEDSFTSGRRKVHEDTDRELFDFTGDNTESSSERDS